MSLEKNVEISDIQILQTPQNNGVAFMVKTFVNFQGELLLLEKDCEQVALTYRGKDAQGQNFINSDFQTQLINYGWSQEKVNGVLQLLN